MKQVPEQLVALLKKHNMTLKEVALRKAPKSDPHGISLQVWANGYDGSFEGVKCFSEIEPKQVAAIGYIANPKQGAMPLFCIDGSPVPTSRQQAMLLLTESLELMLDGDQLDY